MKLSLLPAALATITITGPTESSYWVQFTSNIISWTAAANDPNPVSIIVSNTNDSFLNGDFSIAQFVDINQKSFTVTNVTLRVDDGYTVTFVNPSNASQIYATGPTFSVKPAGTAPAPNATASSNSTSTSSSSAPGSTGSSSSNSSSSGSGSGTGAPSPTNAVKNSGFRPTTGVASAIAAAGVISLVAALL